MFWKRKRKVNDSEDAVKSVSVLSPEYNKYRQELLRKRSLRLKSSSWFGSPFGGSVMRRGVYGIYHQISFKHLQAYCNEYSYRHNSCKLNDGDRFLLILERIGCRLSYKNLIYGTKD